MVGGGAILEVEVEMRKKLRKFEGLVREAVGFFFYRSLEFLGGETFPNIRIISYRITQPLKIKSLSLTLPLIGGVR